MKIIIVTGLIASGKSQVCKILENKGAYYFSCDKIVDYLYKENKPLQEKLVNIFGQEILKHGKICKAKLAALVFRDKNQLNILEKIIHPLVKQKLKQTIHELKNSKKDILIIEMPAIKNSILTLVKADKIIFVEAKEATRFSRAERNGVLKKDFFLRQQYQSQDALNADIVIDNNATFVELDDKLNELYEQLNAI